MNDNTGRQLILRVEIKDPKQAEWLWNAHSADVNGIRVWEMANREAYCIASDESHCFKCDEEFEKKQTKTHVCLCEECEQKVLEL